MAIERADFEAIRVWAKKHAAVDLSPDKSYLVETRLDPVAQRHGLDNLAGLVPKLLSSGRHTPLFLDCIDAITTHETSFFRDFKPFEFLRKQLFPEIAAMNLKNRRLSIWSAACSTGQEIYTIAMILREHFPQMLNWDLQLDATDISDNSLDKARKGEFSQVEISRGLPAQFLVKYFEKSEKDKFQLKDEIRRMVKFKQLNLAERWPLVPPYHVIFLRNVLIYFDTDTKREILDKLKVYLHADGVLVLGSAETTMNLDDDYVAVRHQGTTIYKLKGP